MLGNRKNRRAIMNVNWFTSAYARFEMDAVRKVSWEYYADGRAEDRWLDQAGKCVHRSDILLLGQHDFEGLGRVYGSAGG
jgi:hypothetical protein